MNERPLRSSWRMDAAMASIAAVLAVAVFAGTLRGGWAYDDEWLLHRNRLICEPGHAWAALKSDIFAAWSEDGKAKSPFWRPTWTAWMIANHRIFGLDRAAPWRAGNLGLHVLVTVLAFATMRRLGLGPLIAGSAACVLAVHPTRVETVAWVSGAPDLLAAAALLGSMLCVLKLARGWNGRRPSGPRADDVGGSVTGEPDPPPPPHSRAMEAALLIGALGLYAIALGAKEPTTLFPAVVFAMVASRPSGGTDGGPWWRDRRRWKPDAAVTMAFFATSLAYLLLRWRVMGGNGPVLSPAGFDGTLYTVPAAAVFYLRQAVIPAWLSPVYPFDVVTTPGVKNFVIPLAFASVAGAGMVWSACRSRAALVGLVFFSTLLAPALAVGWMAPELLVQDRYLYMPLIGLAMLVAGAASIPRTVGLQGRCGLWIACAAGAACIPLAWQTVRYGPAWRSNEALWEWCVRATPSSRFAWEQYARALLVAEKPEGAAEAMERSLAIANDAGTRQLRAMTLLRLKRYDEAEREFLALLEPPGQNGVDDVVVVDGLAQVWMERDHDVARALGMCRDARQQLPAAHAAITVRIAAILVAAGRTDEAVEELENARAAAARERSATARMVLLRLGELYLEHGRGGEARSAFVEFLRATEGASDPGLVRARRSASAKVQTIDGPGARAPK